MRQCLARELELLERERQVIHTSHCKLTDELRGEIRQLKQNATILHAEILVEETEKAESLFHEIVVEKSRDIYEGLAETTDETAVESKEETSEDKVEETAEDKVEETETEKAVDEATKTDEGEEVEIEETSKEEATEEKTD